MICVFKYSAGDVLDIVGTGGDQIDTFNVSTASGFVLAACGQKVAKHGNRSSSGRCGAADLVEALGVNLNLEPEKLSNIVEKLGFGFLFAQKFHPAMKSVAPIRREIGVRTIFNVLGPLTNPAKPAYIVAGVGTKELGDLYSKVLRLAGMKAAWVVHSEEGMDEISPAGNTYVSR
jgi:anthranilate phosphoribosyltransferase